MVRLCYFSSYILLLDTLAFFFAVLHLKNVTNNLTYQNKIKNNHIIFKEIQ